MLQNFCSMTTKVLEPLSGSIKRDACTQWIGYVGGHQVFATIECETISLNLSLNGNTSLALSDGHHTNP